MEKCLCGNDKKKGLKTCGGRECANKARTLHQIGRKRPQHSALMKKYASEGRLDKWKVLKNKDINGLEFKKKRLMKHGYEFNDNNINEVYSKLLSEVQKTPEVKINKLKKFISTPKYYDSSEFMNSCFYGIDDGFINKLNNKEIEEYTKSMNSLMSIIAMKNNPNMGASKSSKRSILRDLKHNLSGKTTVLVKSSYEKNFVEFFEKNGIAWDYEPYTIKTSTGWYLPDFIIKVGKRTTMIEVKGYLKDIKEYKKSKLKFALSHCKKNDIDLSFMYRIDKVNSIKEIYEHIIRRV